MKPAEFYLQGTLFPPNSRFHTAKQGRSVPDSANNKITPIVQQSTLLSERTLASRTHVTAGPLY